MADLDTKKDDQTKKVASVQTEVKKSEETPEITNQELLNKAEEMINNDLQTLPSDEELLAEIDKMITNDTVAKSAVDDDKESQPESSETPKKDFPGKKVKGGEGGEGQSANGDDSKEEGGGYKANPDSPDENFPGKTVAAAGGSGGKGGSTGGDDSKEKGGGYMANGCSPDENFPGQTVMKSLDTKFDVLIDCIKGMNEKLDTLTKGKMYKADEEEGDDEDKVAKDKKKKDKAAMKKSEEDEVADDVIGKAQVASAVDAVAKAFKGQLDEITKSLGELRTENGELKKALRAPAAKRQSLTNYNQIEKSDGGKPAPESMSKGQQMAKLEKMFKSGRKELGDDIIKLNSAGILTPRAREALAE